MKNYRQLVHSERTALEIAYGRIAYNLRDRFGDPSEWQLSVENAQALTAALAGLHPRKVRPAAFPDRGRAGDYLVRWARYLVIEEGVDEETVYAVFALTIGRRHDDSHSNPTR